MVVTMNQSDDGAMEIEIIDQPIRLRLHGKWSVVENQCYGEVGLRLMNEIWRAVKDAKVETTGINHWVYMADERMFVGVEVKNAQQATIPNQLELFDFELRRYMKHLHIGPYQALPQKWKDLKTELDARGEIIGFPSLEVYGHACEDPTKAETTILIGLKQQST
jgi:effector-binding domain-containing protein